MKKLIITLVFLFFPLPILAAEKIDVTLDSCIDGDTVKFVTDKGVESTRLLAIDTPETKNVKEPERFGLEASDLTCNALKKAKKIVLEFDDNSDRYDKYKRLLAWVFVDDVLLQGELVKKGYAEVAYLYGDYKYTAILQDYEGVARGMKVGLWGEEETSTGVDYGYLIGIAIVTIVCGYVYKKFGVVIHPNKVLKKKK